MDTRIETIKSLIQPIFNRRHMYLLGVELRGQLNNQVLSIYADTDTGITIDEITEITREIEDVLDIHDPIEGHYRLEVSSPGIDWPLKEIWQFRKNLNRQLRVLYKVGEEQKEAVGTLLEVNEDSIVIQLKKETAIIPLNKIVNAVVKLKW